MTPEDLQHIEKIVRRTVKKFMPRGAYTFEQAAHRLGISKNRIKQDYILTGRLGVVIIDGQVKIPDNEIENFLKRNTKYSNPLINNGA